MKRVFIALALGAAMMPFGETARAEELRVFGHELHLLNSPEADDLKINGRSLHSNEIISIDEFAVVAGVPVIIGISSAGGNACDASHSFCPFQQVRHRG